MAAFKTISVNEASVDVVNRIQQNVATKFAELDEAPAVPVLDVMSSTNVRSYEVTPDNLYLVVNARGGPIRIVLPTPNRKTQSVSILNGYETGNVVSVAQADGKFDPIQLAVGETAQMVCTGKTWVRFGQ